MLSNQQVEQMNALALRWHAGAPSVGISGFQAWALAALGEHLRFDAALWCSVGPRRTKVERRLGGIHTHRLTEDVLDDLESARVDLFAEGSALGRVHNVCIKDARWEGPEHAEMCRHGRRHGLVNTLGVLLADVDAATRQLLVLSRKTASSRFKSEEARRFGLLAPHMSQAYTTCRALFLHAATLGDRRSVEASAAVVDRPGLVLNQSSGFAELLRREWSDWLGDRLPEPLLDALSRRQGGPGRYLGACLAFDIVPVGDCFLVTVQPRQPADVLSAREGAIAQAYAAGGGYREIAEALGLAPATVRAHLRNVYSKLQVSNKAQLATVLRGS